MKTAFFLLSLVLTGINCQSTQTGTNSAATAVASTNAAAPATTQAPTTVNAAPTGSSAASSASGSGTTSSTPPAGLTAEITADVTGKVALNKNVTLTCEASRGTSPYTYTWSKDDKPQTVVTDTFTFTSSTKASVRVGCDVTDAANDTATSEVYTVVFSGASNLSLNWSLALIMSVCLAFVSSAKTFH